MEWRWGLAHGGCECGPALAPSLGCHLLAGQARQCPREASQQRSSPWLHLDAIIAAGAVVGVCQVVPAARRLDVGGRMGSGDCDARAGGMPPGTAPAYTPQWCAAAAEAQKTTGAGSLEADGETFHSSIFNCGPVEVHRTHPAPLRFHCSTGRASGRQARFVSMVSTAAALRAGTAKSRRSSQQLRQQRQRQRPGSPLQVCGVNATLTLTLWAPKGPPPLPGKRSGRSMIR